MRSLALVSLFVSSSAFAGEVTIPLAEYEKKKAELIALQAAQMEASLGSGVVVGETIYTGKSDGKNLRLQLDLHAQLGDAKVFKTVPVIGAGAVILSAMHGRERITLIQEGSQWVWHTDVSGAVELTVDFVVPPRGPRGSIEYAFGVIQSPVTQLVGFFPYKGLSPRVNDAVTSKVTAVEGGTELQAVLQPTNEIHIVGFHEVKGDEESRAAKVYGETQNLVSLSEEGIELFSVVAFTILYAPEKRFRIELPAGYDIVSADGQGAFRYRVETIDHHPVLIGETAFGMHDRYEISLRLERALAPTDAKVLLPVPRLLDVERDTGFVAIEIPGKLSVENVEGDGLVGIDVRELPSMIVDNSVSPVVRAFRYADRRSPVWVSLARYPEATLASGGVDHLRASTTVTADGRAMTEARFTIRNNLQQYLAVKLADGAEVKSASIDGEPIKPSRDKFGSVLVPLVRSRNENGALVPFKLQLVYEERVSVMGAFGRSELELPKLDVPIASVLWRVFAPGGYETSTLITDHAPQTFVKNASWHRTGGWSEADEEEDPYDALEQGAGEDISDEHRAALRAGRASGAVPVRVSVPEAGQELSIQSYWVEADRPVVARFWYARTPYVLFVQLLWRAAIAIALLLVARRFWSRQWTLARARSIAVAQLDSMRQRAIAAKNLGVLRLAGIAARSFVVFVVAMWVLERALSLIDLLGRPL
jgi:hypothetical protein